MSFLDLREKVFFLNTILRTSLSPRGLSFFLYSCSFKTVLFNKKTKLLFEKIIVEKEISPSVSSLHHRIVNNRNHRRKKSLRGNWIPAVSFLRFYTEFPIGAATMRLRGRAIFPLVRTTSTSAASSPPTAALSVGRALRERRRFTEDDVAAYAAVSGDRNPVHLDDAAARDLGGFQRGRVVHGMLVASLFPSIIAASFVRTLLPLFFPAFRRTARERGVSQSAFASWFGWFSLELCTRTRRSSSRRRCTLEMRWLLEFRR